MEIIIFSILVLVFAFAGSAFIDWHEKHYPEDSDDPGPQTRR